MPWALGPGGGCTLRTRWEWLRTAAQMSVSSLIVQGVRAFVWSIYITKQFVFVCLFVSFIIYWNSTVPGGGVHRSLWSISEACCILEPVFQRKCLVFDLSYWVPCVHSNSLINTSMSLGPTNINEKVWSFFLKGKHNALWRTLSLNRTSRRQSLHCSR